MRQAEMELKKGQNMIEHESEIYSRPARTWFQSSKEKQKAEGLPVDAREHFLGLTLVVRRRQQTTVPVGIPNYYTC